MKGQDLRSGQYFFGTLEQCVEQHGGSSRFTISAPLTFFSGARLETHRRAQSNDGAVVIVERQSSPTVCEVYLAATPIRPHTVFPDIAQSNCA